MEGGIPVRPMGKEGLGTPGAVGAMSESEAPGIPRGTPSVPPSLLLALLGVAFAPALVALAGVWESVDYYSHGYLIPIVAGWAAWRDRDALAGLPIAPDRRGLAWILAALAVYGVGLLAGLVEVQGAALVAAVAAAVLLLRGAQWLRALAFPIGFLLFMVPVPDAWIGPLILRLRLLVTTIAAGILQRVGLPVAREGNVLTLPGGEALFVADACSGVTSLVTLAPLAVLLAYYSERTLGRRLLLVSAVVPIALAGNLLRVIVTVVAARYVGVGVATESVLHDSAGLLTYVLGCLALLGVSALLRRTAPEP